MECTLETGFSQIRVDPLLTNPNGIRPGSDNLKGRVFLFLLNGKINIEQKRAVNYSLIFQVIIRNT
jgi:hypothetical protein